VSPGLPSALPILSVNLFGAIVGSGGVVVGDVVGTVVSPTFTPPSKNCVFCSTRSLFANPPTSTNLITLSPLGAPDFTFATIVANTPSLVIAYAPVPLSSANRNTIIFLSGYTAVSKLLSGFGSTIMSPGSISIISSTFGS